MPQDRITVIISQYVFRLLVITNPIEWDTNSTLIPKWIWIMAWCCQAISHFLNQCWLSSITQYAITRPQWFNILRPVKKTLSMTCNKHLHTYFCFKENNAYISLKLVPGSPMHTKRLLIQVMQRYHRARAQQLTVTYTISEWNELLFSNIYVCATCNRKYAFSVLNFCLLTVKGVSGIVARQCISITYHQLRSGLAWLNRHNSGRSCEQQSPTGKKMNISDQQVDVKEM